MSVSITLLGCGSSGGVPRVGQGWGACDPNEVKNRRRRCSALVERQGAEGVTRVLIDTSPDLREQLIDAGVDHLDGVILTHDHADHTHGLDDLRPLTILHRRRIDVFADAMTARSMLSRFGYCFVQPEGSSYPPILRLNEVRMGEGITIQGRGGALEFETFRLHHGDIDSLGLKVNNAVYSPDVNGIPAESLAALKGLDLWILDALRPTAHPTHFSLPEALEWIRRMLPRRAVLTNLHTDLDYVTLAASLPENIVPAYDGMRITLS